MSVFFTDLDNTMIYSHRRKINRPKTVVEHLNGQVQSYMTNYTYQFLRDSDWLTVVPVTTRTEQQYRRIECASNLRFKCAIICNGAKLLVDGKEDEKWLEETRICAGPNIQFLQKATDQLSNLLPNTIIHRPEEYMSYVKCSDPESVYRNIIKSVNPNQVNVQKDGRKVYLFACGISKGIAVERFIKMRGYETVIVAGDSMMDVSMLNKADYAFASQAIYDMVECNKKIKIENGIFSDGICKCLHDMRKNEIL